MSAAQQAKAKRRKMRTRYAYLGGAMRRPTVSGQSFRSVSESIAAARYAAAREAKSKTKKKA